MATVLGEFEQLLLLAVMRLGEGAYGVTVRQEIQRATGRDVSAGAVGYKYQPSNFRSSSISCYRSFIGSRTLCK